MSYFERKNWGTVDDNRLAIPNIEEIYGEQRQENSVLYLIALSPLYKQGSQAEKQLLNYLSTSKYQYISCQTSKPNKWPVLNNLVTIHGGVHLNQAKSERFYLHPNRPRLT